MLVQTMINSNELQTKANKYANGKNTKNTVKSYHNGLNKFIEYLQQNQILELNNDNIKEVIYDYNKYLIKLSKDPDSTIGKNTSNQYMILLQKFFNDYINIDFPSIELQRIKPAKPVYLKPDEIKKVLSYPDIKPLDYTIILLIVNTGLRISEALSITIKQLENSINKEGNAIITISGKTGKRNVLIPSEVVNALKEYYTLYSINKKYVFSSNKSNNHITVRTIERHLKALANELDTKYNTSKYSIRLKPHKLRHSYAVHSLDSININYVMKILGHQNIETTQIYVNPETSDTMKQAKEVKLIR